MMRARRRRRDRCYRGERVVAGAVTSGEAHRCQRPSRRRRRRSSLCRPPTGHVYTGSRGSIGAPPTVSEGEGEGEEGEGEEGE